MTANNKQPSTSTIKFFYSNVRYLVSYGFVFILLLLSFYSLSEQIVTWLNNSDATYQRILQATFLSVILFCISLFLPSYAESSGTFNGRYIPIRYKSGAETLVSGLLLGWASILTKNYGAVAVYANIFYGYVVIRLVTSPFLPPLYSAVMILILASQTFRFHHIGHEISFPMSNRVTLWGWGAIIWLLSLSIVIILPFLIASQIPIPSLGFFIIGVLIILVMMACVQYFRYVKANILEKDKYFAIGVALITQRMSDINYNPPPPLLMNKDTVIELDTNVKMDFNKELPYRHYIPSAFNYKGIFYKKHYLSDFSNTLIEFENAKKPDYYYQFLWIDSGYKFLLTKAEDKNHPLWQEIFYINHPKQYHDYKDELTKLFQPLASHHKKNIAQLMDELTHQQFIESSHNDNYHFEFDKENLRLALNEKHYIISGYHPYLENLKLFCSDEYAVIISDTIKVKQTDGLVKFRYDIDAWLFKLNPTRTLIYYQFFQSYHELFQKPENIDSFAVQGVRFGYYDGLNKHPHQDFIDKKDLLPNNPHYEAVLIVQTPYGELGVRSQLITDVFVDE